MAVQRGPLPDYHCPACGVESTLIISPRQAFCTGGDECHVLMFAPSLPDGGMSDARTVDLGFLADKQEADKQEPGLPPQ